MEKIILKSNSQEVVFNPRDGSVCESFVYEPQELPDKKLGNLYVLGYLDKKPGEDIEYIINLISSLMKREYYSDPNASPKASFEKGLKKLNEVLKDFFRDKEADLDLGILAIAGDNMLISKLGKFKILLSRGSEFIDIFNNVGLFGKDRIREEEFSNVVSGKLMDNDTVFAYHPNRKMVTRESKIKDLIKASATSADFTKGMEKIQAKTAFPCHGIHISIEKIRELASIPRPIVSSSPSAEQRTGVQNILKDLPDLKKQETPQEPIGEEISPAELSLTKRANGIDKLFATTKTIKSMKPAHKFAAGVLIVAVAVTAILSFRALGRSSAQFKAAKETAENGLNRAGQSLAINNLREARSVLGATLAELQQYDSEKVQEFVAQVEEKLKEVDKVSTKQAMLFVNLSEEGITASHVIKTANNLFAFNKANGSFTNLSGNPENETVYVFVEPNKIYLTDKDKPYDKTLDEEIKAQGFYTDNFYFANSEGIFKYADVAMRGAKKTEWLKEEYKDNIISLAADNSIYALTSEGKFVEYYAGARKQEIDLQITPSIDAEVLTKQDMDRLFVFDPQKKEIKSFNRENGNIIETCDISYIENPQSVSLGDSGEIYILSSDNKIWKL